jgi:hypothetical protein
MLVAATCIVHSAPDDGAIVTSRVAVLAQRELCCYRFHMRRAWAFGSIVAAVCIAASARAAAPETVDVALVIATDVSPSIDEREAHLQREGIAQAFLNPQVVQAIQSGSLGKIAVTAIDFSSREFNRIVIDWRIIRDPATAAAFAADMRKAPPVTGRHTSISDAVELAERLLDTPALEPAKKVIDISGDGPNNWGRPMNAVRDEAVSKGIVINGLPIMGSAYELDKYYASCVVGGPGSFMVVAHGFEDFAQAIRNKLIQEIALSRQPSPLLVKVAAQPAVPPARGYTPSLNERGCENEFGGFGPTNGFDFPIPLGR